MARKSVANLKGQQAILDEAVGDFKLLSEVKYELAKQAYDAQTPAMQDVIDQLVKTLRIHARDTIEVQLDPPKGALVPVKIEPKWIDYNLLYIVMDMLKNLALFDIKVFEYVFPPSLCTNCEAEIEERETKKRKVKTHAS